MTSKLVKCTCKHAFQDEMYGVGNRVANEMRSGQLSCTVCGATIGTQSITTVTKVKAKDPAAEPAITKEPEKKGGKEKRVKGINKTKTKAEKAKVVKGKKIEKPVVKKGGMKGGKR